MVSVNPTTLGDACPLTPKYLEVHYFCKVETSPSVSRHSPHFPDTELTALWNPNSHKVNIDSVLRAMKDRENDVLTQRVPITTVPSETSNSTTGPSPKLQFALSDVEEINYSEEPQTEGYTHQGFGVDQSSILADETTIEASPFPETKERFGAEEDPLGWDGEEEAPETKEDTVNTMFVLEVITYAVASLCGIILIFLAIKVGIDPIFYSKQSHLSSTFYEYLFQFRRARLPCCSCLRTKQTSSGFSDSSSGSCLNSLPVEHCKMPAAGDSLRNPGIGAVNHCMELEPSRTLGETRYSLSSLANISEIDLSNSGSQSGRARSFGQFSDKRDSNVSPYPEISTPNPNRILPGSPPNGQPFRSDAYLDSGQIGNSIYGNGQPFPSSPYLTVVRAQCGICQQDALRSLNPAVDYHLPFDVDQHLHNHPPQDGYPAPRSGDPTLQLPRNGTVMGSDV